MQNFRFILFQFYKPLFFWNLLFSGAAFIGITLYDAGFLGVSFIIKALGYASSIWFQYYFSNQTYYYFRNAGYLIRKLYAYVFLFDILVYLIAVSFYLTLGYFYHVKS